MNLDIEWVRRQFPALGRDWVFMDNAGGSQILGSVVERIRDYLVTSNVQLGASYEISRQATSRVAEGVAAISEYLGASSPSEVLIGSSTSLLLRVLSVCLARGWKAGDEVVVTDCDHEANIGPWADLADRGVVVRNWPIDPESLALRLEDLEPLLTDRTRLVALTHVSNVIGTIHPIREVARLAHSRGAMVCVDGVAHAPHRRVDVRRLEVDFYAFSFYKVYGPHCAVLFGRREHLERLARFNHYFLDAEIPYRLQPGGVNYELTFGLLGLRDYFNALALRHGGVLQSAGEDASGGVRGEQLEFAFDLIARHEESLSARLLEFLRARRNVRIIGLREADRSRRVPTVSFTVEGRRSDSIVESVDPHRIGIRFGDFYARRLIERLGLAEQQGVVRVSLVHYNSLEEVDRLLEVLDRVL
jgi:cysteine desulfurase family protein (TIGR01976 family)